MSKNYLLITPMIDLLSEHSATVSKIMAFSMSYLIIISTYFLLVFIPHAASLFFNLTDINPQNQNQDIVTAGNGSYISDSGIQVTPDGIDSNRTQRAGRATYIRLFHLWDKRSGELASFATHFTFVINSNGERIYGDGLTFFLAENNSVITGGGAIGLPVNETTMSMTNPFVAVEFDTYWNYWDPRDNVNKFAIGDHVGININNLDSVRSQKWLSNITYGRECQAWILYDSVSKNISVSFTGYVDHRVVRQVGLRHTVDLKEVLPEWVIFGFSAATGTYFEKNSIKSWSFNGSELQIYENNGLTQNPGRVIANEKTSPVGLIVGLFVTITFLSVLAFVLWRWKKKKIREDEGEELGFNDEMNDEFEMGTGPKRFSYHELARSTGDFAEKEKLGEGGFGKVYRGFLKDSKTYVAVKKLSEISKQGIKEFASEVRIISRLRHRNLVQLMGWCHDKRKLLLVYEFMENGSLDSHLFWAKSLLTWGTRYKIAHGVASALLYLHEEWEQCVLHRDIKSSNVMLDSNFNPKLGDFGLAKLVDHEKGSKTTMLAGTMGYMAPECAVYGKASKESDVFSFGVVALEIACGRKSVLYTVAEARQIYLVEWVWELYRTRKLVEAADPRLGSDFEVEEMERLMIVGLWCAHPDPELRPSMRQAIQVLKSEAFLPILPSKMPVATYSAPPSSSSYGVQDQSSSGTSSLEHGPSSAAPPSMSQLR